MPLLIGVQFLGMLFAYRNVARVRGIDVDHRGVRDEADGAPAQCCPCFRWPINMKLVPESEMPHILTEINASWGGQQLSNRPAP